jgi:hypothetical protein
MAEQLNAAAIVLPTGILQQDFDIIDEQEDHVVLTVRVPLDLIRDNHALLMALCSKLNSSSKSHHWGQLSTDVANRPHPCFSRWPNTRPIAWRSPQRARSRCHTPKFPLQRFTVSIVRDVAMTGRMI